MFKEGLDVPESEKLVSEIKSKVVAWLQIMGDNGFYKASNYYLIASEESPLEEDKRLEFLLASNSPHLFLSRCKRPSVLKRISGWNKPFWQLDEEFSVSAVFPYSDYHQIATLSFNSKNSSFHWLKIPCLPFKPMVKKEMAVSQRVLWYFNQSLGNPFSRLGQPGPQVPDRIFPFPEDNLCP